MRNHVIIIGIISKRQILLKRSIEWKDTEDHFLSFFRASSRPVVYSISNGTNASSVRCCCCCCCCGSVAAGAAAQPSSSSAANTNNNGAVAGGATTRRRRLVARLRLPPAGPPVAPAPPGRGLLLGHDRQRLRARPARVWPLGAAAAAAATPASLLLRRASFAAGGGENGTQ